MPCRKNRRAKQRVSLPSRYGQAQWLEHRRNIAPIEQDVDIADRTGVLAMQSHSRAGDDPPIVPGRRHNQRNLHKTASQIIRKNHNCCLPQSRAAGKLRPDSQGIE